MHGWMEDKLKECMENAGYAWFDSWEQYMEWAGWCKQNGYYAKM